MGHRARLTQKLTRRNLSVAKKLCPQVTALQLQALRESATPSVFQSPGASCKCWKANGT